MLGSSIKVARLRRRWSINELALRAGVSHPTIMKVEKGDPTVAVGTMFEAAVLVGVALFDPDPVVRSRHVARVAMELALLPQAGRAARFVVDDDF